MSDPPANQCGYTWPPDHEADAEPDHQSCCWRPALSDADRCAWHVDPDETDEKTITALQEAYADSAVREQTEPVAELLDGAVLAGCEIGDSISLSRVSLRGADLTHTSLRDADLKSADLKSADLSNAFLRDADLTDASLWEADLTDAFLRDADLINVPLTDADLTETSLNGADLTDARLTNVDLTDADLRSTDLSNAFLRDADLTKAFLRYADLTDADLVGADLTDAFLRYADLTDADLRGADLTNANLRDAALTNAFLRQADLTDADLRGADLSDASLSGAAVSADLERANLTRTDLFDADLRGAEFYAAVTTDTQINEDTAFGDHYVSEHGTVSHEDSQKARWCARTIEQIAEDNALPDTARDAFLTRRRRKRSEAWHEGEWSTWIHLTVSGLLMGYSESFRRVLTAAVVVIGTATLLYPWLGVKPTGDGPRLAYPPLTPDAPIQYATELVETLLTAGYFSLLTFTTLGFGDLRPVGLGRVIATVEAAFGVTLFALFVFVLGRRATR